MQACIQYFLPLTLLVSYPPRGTKKTKTHPVLEAGMVPSESRPRKLITAQCGVQGQWEQRRRVVTSEVSGKLPGGGDLRPTLRLSMSSG